MMRADITQPESTSSPMPTLVDAEEGLVVGQPNSKQQQAGPEFLGMVRNMVQRERDTVFATWYNENGRMASTHTFGDLWEEAGVIAHHLRCKWELEKGDHVVLCYNFGLHFFATFLGCLRAGVVAVLVYPPTQPLTRSLPKMDVVIKNCGAKLILCDSDVMLLHDTDTINPFSKSRKLWPSGVVFQTRTSVLYQKQGSGSTSRWNNFFKQTKKQALFDENNLQDSDVAFLQYTSGSTGEPKGVTITFGNLAANVRLLLDGLHHMFTEDPTLGQVPKQVVGFSWLPQYHDMGLVYGTIAPFVGGWQQHYMSPVAFIKKPLLWLELMSRHKVAMGVAPDFAYRLVVRKFLEARKRNGGQDPIPNLDLSSIRFLSNAAEPVRPDTRDQFFELLAPYGLRPDFQHIGYGLAEHVVTISWLHGHRLSTGTGLVAVGSRHTFHSSVVVKIVDPNTFEELEDGQEGEVWVSSPCVANGYYGKEDLSQQVFRAKCEGCPQDFLRTGDFGFFEDDHLYICGRMKDVIIVNGTNYFPQDIEAAVTDASEAVRSGCVAAFSRNDSCGDESVDIVFEIRKASEKDVLDVVASIRSAVASKIGIVAGQVVAIKERSIPKTTSGKIQRRECRARLQKNTLAVVHMSDPSRHQAGNQVDEESPQQEELSFDERYEQLLQDVLGSACDPNTEWGDLGLSSMTSVQLQNAIADDFNVMLEPNAFDMFCTPSELKAHIVDMQQGTALPVKCPELPRTKTTTISWGIMALVQAIGIAFHLLLFSIPIVPAYCLTDLVLGHLHWSWGLPLAVPLWMVGFSLLLVASKWLVVGRYKEQEFPINSIAYLRWWWVDRAVHMWETWVGHYFKKTPLLWIVYRCMGAQIDMTATLDACVREFDLVQIDQGVSLEHQVRCRKFGPWDEKDKTAFPLLRFRPVAIAKDAVVRGMISPGGCIGEKVRIEIRSVIPEGGQVPSNARVQGNRIVNDLTNAEKEQQQPQPQQTEDPFNYTVWGQLQTLKLTWLIVELYVFFGLAGVADLSVASDLSPGWHYTHL